ncbi:SAM-dependent methyltransferase [Actinomadura roseirufa]|uniref:SAM-dependent methyltransferase n=1 Tax=Actinomadura roseirufa TaxID=2094049 RepID=UPI0010417B4C|nr:SAM-dependent methyltransferase [Actinomadura roseirufa]
MTAGSVLNLSQWAVSSPVEEEEERARAAVHAPTPSVARMYDYFLGGKDNYAADREMAEWALLKAPVIPRIARANRAFVRHAAGRLARDAGLRQFLDIGCGLPAPSGNVADVVRGVDPSCRVAYTDSDPMVVAHARALLAVDEGTCAFQADLRDPAALLAAPGPRRLLDFGRPVGVLLFCVLHFLTDADDPRRVMGELIAALPAGSHVALTHVERTADFEAVSGLFESADVPFTPRGLDEITDICAGLELLDPFPVNLPLARAVRPEADEVAGRGTDAVPDGVPDVVAGAAGRLPLIGCIGRKPE